MEEMYMQAFTLSSGNTIPVMGLGTWELEGGAGTISRALECGYRLIDTSGEYGTQPAIGEAIRESDLSRENVFLVTKVEEDEDGYTGTRARLEELGLEYTDLVLIHRPPNVGNGERIWDGLIRGTSTMIRTIPTTPPG
jgi:diketogulonate reductase-like aldo/keto reductase